MKRNPPIFQKRHGRLLPVGAFDAERFDALPEGTEFDIVARSQRSLPQQRTYWLALHRIVEATDRWPDAEHLHDALRRSLGYIHVRKDLTGEPYLALDSTAFDAMSADEFSAYMQRAFSRLTEATGINPTAFLDEQQGAA
jgi:hypothetical protein